MANKVLLKKSSTASKVPLVTDLDYGELALNYTDGKLYYKNSSNVVSSFDSTPKITVSNYNTAGTVSGTITGVTTLRFDNDTGIFVSDLGSGAVKVRLGSSFKTWKVTGQSDLVAVGEDTIQLIAGTGVTLTTNPSGSPYQSLSFAIDTSTVATLTGTQTLGNKTLTSPTVSGLYLSDASIIFEGATADAYETTLTVTDPTADRTITLPDASDTLVGKATTDTLTNKTLSSAVITGTLTAGGSVGTNGQYLQSTATGVQWATVSGGGSGTFTVASSAPSTPSAGDRWLHSTTGVLYTYVDDGDSSQWVDLGDGGGSGGGGSTTDTLHPFLLMGA